MGSRKQAEKEILELVDDMAPNSGNKELYLNKLKKMSDAEFKRMMQDFLDGTDVMRLVIPNYGKDTITLERTFKVAKKYKHSFFERCWLHSPESDTTILSPHSYLVVSLPLRRQSQILLKKIGIPKNNKSVDLLTGQATGASKGSAITAPEAQILHAVGLDNTLTELMNIRGGNRSGMNAFDKSIIETGVGDLELAKLAGGTVKANDALATYMIGMHLDNSINKHKS